MQIRYFGHTDVGLAREHNEDSHLADPDLGVFVVAVLQRPARGSYRVDHTLWSPRASSWAHTTRIVPSDAMTGRGY